MKTAILQDDMKKLLRAEKLIRSIENMRTEKSKLLIPIAEQIYKLEDIISAQEKFEKSL